MSERRRILFATIAAGGGHLATATAMAEALERHFPGRFETQVSDYMADLGLLGADRRHKSFWRWALGHPHLIRAGQHLIDAVPRLTRGFHDLTLRQLAEAAAAHLAREPYDLIVANHGWLTVGLTRAQRRHALRTPVLTFETEPLDASALWAEPRAEHFVVPSTASRDDLIRMGVGRDRIDIVGYPVRQAFLNAPERSAARAELGLEERFTALVSLGGEGVGTDPRPMLEPLLGEDAQVVVMTGRNRALKDRLAPLTRRGLRVEGYTDRMAWFIAAADVVVGKAGPASVFEALAVGRPFVATSYAGLNERAVVRFLERRELGGHAASAGEAVRRALVFRAAGAAEAVAERAAALDLAGMTERLARYIAAYADHGRGDPDMVGAGLD
ncbi:MAG TPA: glycosyltransferase [Alphaproteobacteria bacterium]|nr:glycosyltransferase [Alphaproteobacteria bacterium]